MSLQDKKLQLLGQDDTNEFSDVGDIFSQYGGGGDEEDHVLLGDVKNDDVASLRPQNDSSVQSDVQKKDPIEEVVNNLNNGVEVEVPDTVSVNLSSVKDKKEGREQKILDSDNTISTKEQFVESVAASATKEKKWEEVGAKSEKKLATKTNISAPAEKEKQWEKEFKQNGEFADAPVVEEKKISAEHQDITKNSQATRAPVEVNHSTVISASQSQGQQAKKSHGSKKDKHINPNKKTIMIVDDDIDTLDMYSDVFVNADYNVIRATDGLDALNIISDYIPDLIFTGIVMPRMDGFAMMETLKKNERTADIPVVINSHLGRNYDKKKAEDLGARDFIVRGFTPPREVLKRISALFMCSEYVFRFDYNDSDAQKLAKDLGVENFFVCPPGQEMVLKLSIVDSTDLTFSARFSCVDEKKK